jgi:hypothetical protein
VLCLYVTEFELGETLDESIVGELASFGNTVHAFTDKKVSVVYEGFELVLLHDAGRNDFAGDSHMLVLVHGSLQVEVYDVDRHELFIRSGQDAVEEALGCGDVDDVPDNGKADAFGFCFLRSCFGSDAVRRIGGASAG